MQSLFLLLVCAWVDLKCLVLLFSKAWECNNPFTSFCFATGQICGYRCDRFFVGVAVTVNAHSELGVYSSNLKRTTNLITGRPKSNIL